MCAGDRAAFHISVECLLVDSQGEGLVFERRGVRRRKWVIEHSPLVCSVTREMGLIRNGRTKDLVRVTKGVQVLVVERVGVGGGGGKPGEGFLLLLCVLVVVVVWKGDDVCLGCE